MDINSILFFGSIACVLELLFVYSAPAKKIEIIGNLPIVIVYTNYFFLPFTTKITQYKDLKKAYVMETGFNTKGFRAIYSLFLKFPKKEINVLSSTDKAYLSKECEKINNAISVGNKYTISDNNSISRTVAMLLATPVAFYYALLYFKDKTATFMPFFDPILIMAASLCMFSVLAVLSLILNLFKKVKDNNSVIKQAEHIYDEKRSVNVDSEAKRINDSIIK